MSVATPPATSRGGQQLVEVDAVGDGNGGDDVAMWQRAADLETALAGGDERFVAQHGT
jgi:hypothetical protein